MLDPFPSYAKRKKYVFYVGSDYYGYLIPFTYLLKKINWYLSIS